MGKGQAPWVRTEFDHVWSRGSRFRITNPNGVYETTLGSIAECKGYFKKKGWAWTRDRVGKKAEASGFSHVEFTMVLCCAGQLRKLKVADMRRVKKDQFSGTMKKHANGKHATLTVRGSLRFAGVR